MKAENLEALSRRLGVEPGFTDNWGVQRIASEAALRVILGALDSESLTAPHATTVNQTTTDKFVDSVIVVPRGGSRSLQLLRPGSAELQPTLQLKWQLKTESASDADLRSDMEQSVGDLRVTLISDGTSGSNVTYSDSTQLEIVVSDKMVIGYHTLIVSFTQGEFTAFGFQLGCWRFW